MTSGPLKKPERQALESEICLRQRSEASDFPPRIDA